LGSHSKNIQQTQKASIQIRAQYFFQNVTGRPDILNHSRYTVFGKLIRSENSFDVDLNCLLKFHPNAKEWITSHDVVFYSMHVEKLNWIGGYGTEHYVGYLDEDDWYNIPELRLHFQLSV
jgi:predicted nucleotidyltransferase